MDNQTKYDKAISAAESDSLRDYMDSDLRKAVAEPDEWLAHKWGFSAGYKFGRSQAADHIPDTTKKVDRAMIAAMAMQGLLSNAVWVNVKTEYIMQEYQNDDERASMLARELAEDSVEFADALIEELGKEKE